MLDLVTVGVFPLMFLCRCLSSRFVCVKVFLYGCSLGVGVCVSSCLCGVLV